jgi:hypothetical protein
MASHGSLVRETDEDIATQRDTPNREILDIGSMPGQDAITDGFSPMGQCVDITSRMAPLSQHAMMMSEMTNRESAHVRMSNEIHAFGMVPKGSKPYPKHIVGAATHADGLIMGVHQCGISTMCQPEAEDMTIPMHGAMVSNTMP